MNVRMWKSEASRPTGNINEREKRALEYRKKLLDKFGENRKIKKILMHRHLPKYILNAKKRRQEQLVSRHNKKLNKEANTGVKEDILPDKMQAIEKMELEEKSFKARRSSKKQREEEEEQEEQYYQ